MNSEVKSVRQFLQQRIVLLDGNTQQLGTIIEAFLHPTQGQLLGFAIQPDHQTMPLQVALNYLLFTANTNLSERTIALTDSFTLVEELGNGVTTYQEFLATKVITEEGEFCGCIEEVYFSEEGLRTIYQVNAPGFRSLFRKPHFIEGSHSDFYSRRYRRLILPVGTPRFHSLTEMIEGREHLTALAFVGDKTCNQDFSRNK